VAECHSQLSFKLVGFGRGGSGQHFHLTGGSDRVGSGVQQNGPADNSVLAMGSTPMVDINVLTGQCNSDPVYMCNVGRPTRCFYRIHIGGSVSTVLRWRHQRTDRKSTVAFAQPSAVPAGPAYQPDYGTYNPTPAYPS